MKYFQSYPKWKAGIGIWIPPPDHTLRGIATFNCTGPCSQAQFLQEHRYKSLAASVTREEIPLKTKVNFLLRTVSLADLAFNEPFRRNRGMCQTTAGAPDLMTMAEHLSSLPHSILDSPGSQRELLLT